MSEKVKKMGTRAKKVVAVSGGFDPLHVGHVRLLEAAKRLGDELVVILNNDNWLRAKKGFVFMPEKERTTVIGGLKSVDRVVLTSHRPNDTDRSVARELRHVKPHIFANGGDRDKKDAKSKTSSLNADQAACEELGTKMVFNVGRGGKMQSSSWLTGRIVGQNITDKRPWGHEEVLKVEPRMWIKTLTIDPGHRFSLQRHKYRDEIWVCIKGVLIAEIAGVKHTMSVGDVLIAKRGQTHRLSSEKGGTIAEVAVGPRVVEDDSVRLEDDYGRS